MIVMLSRYAVKVVPRDLNSILVHLYCEQKTFFITRIFIFQNAEKLALCAVEPL